MIKMDDLYLFGEYGKLDEAKTVWWKKSRRGTLLLLKNHKTNGEIVTFIADSQPVRMDYLDGYDVCYDIVRCIENIN